MDIMLTKEQTKSYSIGLDTFILTFKKPIDYPIEKSSHINVFLEDKILFTGYVKKVENYKLILRSYFALLGENE